MRSPCRTGNVAIRTSSGDWLSAPIPTGRHVKPPSCGARRSAMSSEARTFNRLVSALCIAAGMRSTSSSSPSIRKRTRTESADGSKCTSEA